MAAIFLFCVLPMLLLCVACIGASIIQIGFNSMEDKDIQNKYEDNNGRDV